MNGRDGWHLPWGGAGDVASPFDKTVIDKTSCFATESSPLSLPPFSKNIQPFVNSFQIPLKYDKKAGKQNLQHDFYMKTDSITTQNALDENSLGFWRDFYASNHVKVARTPETCSKICFPAFLSYLSGIWKEFTNGWIFFENGGHKNFSVVSDSAGIGSWLCWKWSFWGFLMLHTARIDFCEAYFALESALGQQTEPWNVLRGFGWLSLVISASFPPFRNRLIVTNREMLHLVL